MWRHARKLLATRAGVVEARAAEEVRIGPEQRLVVGFGDWFYCSALVHEGTRRTAKSLAHGIFIRIAAVRIVTTANNHVDESPRRLEMDGAR